MGDGRVMLCPAQPRLIFSLDEAKGEGQSHLIDTRKMGERGRGHDEGWGKVPQEEEEKQEEKVQQGEAQRICRRFTKMGWKEKCTKKEHVAKYFRQKSCRQHMLNSVNHRCMPTACEREDY